MWFGALTSPALFVGLMAALECGRRFGCRYRADYGLRMGLDVAYGDDDVVFYVTVGTGWIRP